MQLQHLGPSFPNKSAFRLKRVEVPAATVYQAFPNLRVQVASLPGLYSKLFQNHEMDVYKVRVTAASRSADPNYRVDN